MFSDLGGIHPSRLHRITWGMVLFVIILRFLILGQISHAEDILEAV